MTQQQTKIKTFFLIRNGESWLYYNKALFKGGYYFKPEKVGAVMLDREKADKVLKYLKQHGFYDCVKNKVRKQ